MSTPQILDNEAFDIAVLQMISKTASIEDGFRSRIDALEAENAALRKQAAIPKTASDIGKSGLPTTMEPVFAQAVESLAKLGMVAREDIGRMQGSPEELFGHITKVASMTAPSMSTQASYGNPGNLPIDRQSAALESNVRYNEGMARLRAFAAANR